MLIVSTDVRHKAGFSDKFWWIYKEVFVMKTWRTPEMKVYSVKMDENIANSGDNGHVVLHIDYDIGGITRGGAKYKCSPDRRIQDTGVFYEEEWGERFVSDSYVTEISDCLA